MTAPVTLLLVEDDYLVAELLSESLQEAGFAVVCAGTGIKAFAELDKQQQPFSAVITDIRLGNGPNGWEIGLHARKQVTMMPVIYISGDSARDWSSQGVPNSIMLQKPFLEREIIGAVMSLLNNTNTRI